MKKFYCIICGKHRKFRNPKISNIFEKNIILSLSIIYGKCENENEKIRKKKNINWDIKNFWFNWEYKITLKICSKKT